MRQSFLGQATASVTLALMVAGSCYAAISPPKINYGYWCKQQITTNDSQLLRFLTDADLAKTASAELLDLARQFADQSEAYSDPYFNEAVRIFQYLEENIASKVGGNAAYLYARLLVQRVEPSDSRNAKVLRLLERAMDDEVSSAFIMLAKLHSDVSESQGFDYDKDKHETLLRKAIAFNNGTAVIELLAASSGTRVEIKRLERKLKRIVFQSVRKDRCNIVFSIALNMHRGRIDSSPEHTQAWMSAAAKAGFARAYYLGSLYETDVAVRNDLLVKAAKGGYGRAQTEVAKLSFAGALADFPDELTLAYLQEDGRSGALASMRILVDIYQDGFNSIQQDSAQALNWLKKIADHPEATEVDLFRYAELIMRGSRVETDLAEAATYLQRAAKMGSPKAYQVLSRVALFGVGVEKDLRKYHSLVLQAANLGDHDSVTALVAAQRCVFNGKPNKMLEQQWADRAFALGVSDEVFFRLKAAMLTPAKADDKQVLARLKLMAVLGNKRVHLFFIDNETDREQRQAWENLFIERYGRASFELELLSAAYREQGESLTTDQLNQLKYLADMGSVEAHSLLSRVYKSMGAGYEKAFESHLRAAAEGGDRQARRQIAFTKIGTDEESSALAELSSLTLEGDVRAAFELMRLDVEQPIAGIYHREDLLAFILSSKDCNSAWLARLALLGTSPSAPETLQENTAEIMFRSEMLHRTDGQGLRDIVNFYAEDPTASYKSVAKLEELLAKAENPVSSDIVEKISSIHLAGGDADSAIAFLEAWIDPTVLSNSRVLAKALALSLESAHNDRYFSWLEDLSRSGNDQAQKELASLLKADQYRSYAKDIMSELAEAVKVLEDKKAARFYLHLLDKGFEDDFDVGQQTLKLLESGDADLDKDLLLLFARAYADTRFGELYDLARSRAYFEQAISYGGPSAKRQFADSLRSHEGLTDQVLSLYRVAAAEGDTQSMVRLGKIYVADANQEQHTTGLELLAKAKDLGNKDATWQLAKLYHSGPSNIRNLERALEYYEIAATSGDTRAMLAIAYLLVAYPQRFPSEEALPWLAMAAEKGDSTAKSMLESFSQPSSRK